MSTLNRRQFVATAGATAAVGWGPSSFAQAGTKLRCFWWGNPDRDKRTRALLEAYAKKTGMSIAAESLGWGDYWTKLGTQVAGGNAPDLIQMDYRYLFEYARRDTLLPLDALLPLPDFSPGDRNGGKVDGKLYGVTWGAIPRPWSTTWTCWPRPAPRRSTWPGPGTISAALPAKYRR
jgi:multiple sugar transport system substrate-binding protein